MPISRRLLFGLAATGTLAAALGATGAQSGDRLVITLESGDVVIALRPDIAPSHVGQIKAIASEGGYDNVAFHRVIDGFMAQTGDVEFGDLEDGFDPRRVGTGGSSRGELRAEFSNVAFERGTVGMARSQHPDSASSQFFIMYDSAEHLNGQYTVVGQVISGMEHVDAIRKGDRAANGVVADPDRMIRVRVEAAK